MKCSHEGGLRMYSACGAAVGVPGEPVYCSFCGRIMTVEGRVEASLASGHIAWHDGALKCFHCAGLPSPAAHVPIGLEVTE